MKLAERMNRILVESAFEVLVRARRLEAQGRSVVHLEIGEPDFPTPEHIVEAAKRALDEGWTHYGHTQGFPDLREAVAAYISQTRRIRVGPEHVSRAIRKAIESKRPSARYVAPWRTYMALWLITLLPTSWVDATFRVAMGLTKRNLAKQLPAAKTQAVAV